MFQASDATDHRSGELLAVRETAELLKLTVHTTRRLIASGDIPASRVGGSIRVNRDEMFAAVASRPIVVRVPEESE